jgi:hypothetical protein
MSKQTAVEWLISQQKPYKFFDAEIIEQAKKMDKEQKIKSYRDGRSDQQSERQSKFYNRTAEQYYNETFKQ